MPIYLEIYEGDEDDKTPVKRLKLEGACLGNQLLTGRGRRADRGPEVPNLAEIEVFRLVDHDSVYIQRLATEGRAMRMAIVLYDKDNETIYLTLTLTNTMISTYTVIAGSGGKEATEQFNLNFTKATYDYRPGYVHETGQGPGWDLGKGKIR